MKSRLTPQNLSKKIPWSSSRKRRRSSERRPHTLGLGEIPADEFGTPTRQRSCNCKNSKCLKLYCECFAAGVHCDMRFCRCVNCCNNAQNETVRKEAIAITLEKNPNAFKPKVRMVLVVLERGFESLSFTFSCFNHVTQRNITH